MYCPLIQDYHHLRLSEEREDAFIVLMSFDMLALEVKRFPTFYFYSATYQRELWQF